MYDHNRMTEAERQQAREVFSLLLEHGYLCTSLIQRHLKLGYGRAAFLLDLFRELGLVHNDPEKEYRCVLLLSPKEAEDKLEAYLADHAEEEDLLSDWDVFEEPAKPEVKDGVDPLLPRLALTVGVNGDKRLLDRTTLQRELGISDARARALIDVMLQTGVIEPCKQPVYEATKRGDALRKLYDYMGIEMPAGEDVDCLAALLGDSEFTEEE